MINQKRGIAKKSDIDLKKLRIKLEKMSKKTEANIFKIDKKFANLSSWKGEIHKNIKSINLWKIKNDNEFATFKKWKREVTKKSKQKEKECDTISFMVFDQREIIKKNESSIAELKKNFDRIINSQDQIIGMLRKRDQEQVFMGHRLERIEKTVIKIKPLVGLT